jgi:hypothetical protein
MATFSVHYANLVVNETVVSSDPAARIIVLLVCMIPPVLSCMIFFPLNIAPFTILTSVDNMSCHDLMVFALERDHELIERKAHAKSTVEHDPLGHIHSHDDHETPYFNHSSKNEHKLVLQLRSVIDDLKKRHDILEKKLEQVKEQDFNHEYDIRRQTSRLTMQTIQADDTHSAPVVHTDGGDGYSAFGN